MPRDSVLSATPRALIAAGAAGLLLLIYAIAVSAAQMDPVYFSDGWWMLRWILELERGELSFLSYIFHPHGEHFHAGIIALYLLDWKVFAGTQTSIAVVGFASSVAVFAIIAAAARRLPGSVLYRAAVIVFAAAMIASLQGYETWYLQFQAVLSSARLLSVLCLFLVAYGVSNGRHGFSYAGVALGSIAIFTHGTALPLVFVIPGLPLLYRRWKLFAVSLLVPIGFFTVILPYSVSLIRFAGGNSPSLYAPARLLEVLRGSAVLVGGAFARDVGTAAAIGLLGLAAAGAVGFLVVRDLLRDRAAAPWGTLFFLALGTLALADVVLAALLNVLRSNYYGPVAYDYGSMLASRYFMTASGVWVSTAALAGTLAWLRSAPWVRGAGAAIVAALAVFIQLKSVQAVGDIRENPSLRRGHAALLAEVYDPDTIMQLIRPGDFQDEVPGWNRMLRERGRNIHAVAAPVLPSDRIMTVGAGTAVGEGCTFLAAVTVDHPPAVARFEGGALAYRDRNAPRTIEDFDAAAYGRENPDVAKARGTDRTALWQHWSAAGLVEGRKPPVRAGAAVVAMYDGYSSRPCGGLGLAALSP